MFDDLDCNRNDCVLKEVGSSSTLMSWSQTFDRFGNRLDAEDPNTKTTSYYCRTCGKTYTVETQYGKSKGTTYG